MAVEAQYPSNVLLLNPRNNVQDSKTADFSSLVPQQPSAGGGYINQSQHHHVLFNSNGAVSNNVHNSRKRGRDVASTNMVPLNKIFPPSPDSSQFISLSQLHNNHNHHQNVVSTGLRLAFADQNHHYHHNQQQQNHQQGIIYSGGNSSPSSSLLVPLLSGDISNQIKQHRDELDQFLQVQGDELRRTLADKRHKHYRALVTATEESAALRLKEKSEQGEKASRRNAELEARAAQLSLEAQLWQAKARQTEITAVSLQAQLHHLITSGGGCAQNNANCQNDNGLTCAASGGVNEAGGYADDAESAHVDPDRVLPFAGPVCRVCTKRSASVLLLPCRHLCVCPACDPLLQACPVCLTLKDSSVEVFLS